MKPTKIKDFERAFYIAVNENNQLRDMLSKAKREEQELWIVKLGELQNSFQKRISERTAEGLFGDAEKITIQEIMDIHRDLFNECLGVKE